MCTVTYISKKNGYILTSNRDEIASRGRTEFPVQANINGSNVYFPQDPKAGGTWIATSNSGKMVCLLNGAFVRHHHQPPYRLSRGKMVLDIFNFSNFQHFISEYDLDNIEPFTLILVEQHLNDISLQELRWDGEKKYNSLLNPEENHIWSSAPLYTPEVRKNREQLFANWIKQNGKSDQSLLDFHKHGGTVNTGNRIFMERTFGPETVSTTQVISNSATIEKKHFNYLRKSEESVIIEQRVLSNE